MNLQKQILVSGSLVLALVQGGPAVAATWPEFSAGYMNYQLRPASGSVQALNGAFLGSRWAWDRAWSLEGDLREASGRDGDGVWLVQWNAMTGPRYSFALGHELEPYLHLLGGISHLHASEGSAVAQQAKFALTPGAGLDVHLSPRWLVRGQVDFPHTFYGARNQQSLALSLGVGYRVHFREAPATAPLPPPPRPEPVLEEPIAAPAPASTPAPLTPIPPATPVILEMPLVRFANGQSHLSPSALHAIQRFATDLHRIKGDHRLSVTGHASRIGRRNQRLSERRALVVKAALVQAGIPAEAITVHGASFWHPMVPNATPALRARNRRAEIFVTLVGEDSASIMIQIREID